MLPVFFFPTGSAVKMALLCFSFFRKLHFSEFLQILSIHSSYTWFLWSPGDLLLPKLTFNKKLPSPGMHYHHLCSLFKILMKIINLPQVDITALLPSHLFPAHLPKPLRDSLGWRQVRYKDRIIQKIKLQFMKYITLMMHTDFSVPSNKNITLGYHQDVQQRVCKWEF